MKRQKPPPTRPLSRQNRSVAQKSAQMGEGVKAAKQRGKGVCTGKGDFLCALLYGILLIFWRFKKYRSPRSRSRRITCYDLWNMRFCQKGTPQVLFPQRRYDTTGLHPIHPSGEAPCRRVMGIGEAAPLIAQPHTSIWACFFSSSMWKTLVFFDITRAPNDTKRAHLRGPHEPVFDHPGRSRIIIGKACYKATDGGHQPCLLPFPIKKKDPSNRIFI